MRKKISTKIILIFSISLLLFCGIARATENTIKDTVENTTENTIKDTVENTTENTIKNTVENTTEDTTKSVTKSTTDSNIKQNKIEVEYEYNQEKNQVTAKIVSNIELKDTKPTWKLSADKLTYSKVFTNNMNYQTPVEDINGKVIYVDINVNQLKAIINVQYECNSTTNQVTAKIISDTQLKDTKPTWELSADKLTYSKVFTSNMNYETPVEDINGNIINVNININQLKAIINVQYEYNSTTDQVTAKIISNIELKDTKSTWKLSADKLTYSKIFTSNINYETPVEDKNGNIINVNINIERFKATINVQYEYNSTTNQVTAKIISNTELKDTKSTWKLSADKLTYSKVFTSNMNYQTPIQDKYGNNIDVAININQIDMQPPEIIVDYMFNKDDTVTVSLKSNEKLGKTKSTWELDADQLVYKKTFDISQTYITPIQDIYGNTTNVKIDFKIQKYTYKQEDNSTIKVRYLYKGRTEAIVEIISSVKMANTKPTWKLSSDGYSYTKIFNSNNMYVTSVQDINGVTKDVNILVNLFDNYLNGIDVSQHQGKIDWAQVKNSGVDFAILRCGYGQDSVAQDDIYFMRNVMECERLGIPYGVYLYSYALNEQATYSEVNHVLRLIRGHNPTYGVWIDMEDADGYKLRNGMPSDETLVNICEIFCQEIQKNGYNAGVYASLTWFDSKLSSNRLDKYNKWVAQWNSSCSYSKRYVMWQYTSSGIVNGILTNVDMDIYYR